MPHAIACCVSASLRISKFKYQIRHTVHNLMVPNEVDWGIVVGVGVGVRPPSVHEHMNTCSNPLVDNRRIYCIHVCPH